MSDDITFCSNWDCDVVKGCDCNPKNIRHKDIPHSFSDYAGTEYCPKENRSKLKPCPFCGGEAKYVSLSSIVGRVICKNKYCLGTQEMVRTKEEAIKAWNRRAK